MDNKPSLSQYFGGNEVPPASQFFDEIATSPSDMIQSIYLGDNESASKNTPDIYSTNTSFTQEICDEMSFSNVLPTVSGSTPLPATSLPDPSTFFDTIVPEPQIGPRKTSVVANPGLLTEAMEGLSVKAINYNAIDHEELAMELKESESFKQTKLLAENQPVDKEADRRRDAWIPNDETMKILLKAQSSPKGSFFPDREMLTTPGLILEEELADALQEVAVKYLGVSCAGSRGVVRAEHVSRDEAGLRELLRTGYLRAAVNLTAVLITAAGQGVGRMHRPTKHTPRSLQLWLTRFALMLRIKLHEPLSREAEPFGECSKPDMFYQFYPDQYENRTGSLVPFSLRLLLAELPGHLGKPDEAIEKLYVLLNVINKMLVNLRDGKTEDGSGTLSSEQDKIESIRLWSGRETRVLHSITNSAIAMKDYRQASKILSRLVEQAPTGVQRRGAHSAMCRVWLVAGHLRAATTAFELAREARNHLCPTPDVREYVDLGLMDIAYGKYQEAYNNFARAADQEPTNIMVANNLSVCLLYMGRLKEAISVLQKAINSDPERGLNESLLINLCTLYELESSKTNEKKLNLLRMLCKYKSDTIPNVLECLKLA